MAERLGLLCIDDEARVLQASRQQLRRALDVEIHLEVADCGEEGLEVMDELGEQGATSPFRGDAGASTSRGVPLSPRGDPSPPRRPHRALRPRARRPADPRADPGELGRAGGPVRRGLDAPHPAQGWWTTILDPRTPGRTSGG
jgi:hypothetical protein